MKLIHNDLYKHKGTSDLYLLVCSHAGWRLERLEDNTPLINAWYSRTTIRYILKHNFTPVLKRAGRSS